MIKKRPIELDDSSSIFILVIVLSMLMLPNGFYLLASFATLILMFFRIQSPYGTGIFSIILLQHSIQIFATVLQANYLNNDINYRSPSSGIAVILSLFGLIALFIPVIYFKNKLPQITRQDFEKHAKLISTNKAMYFYIAAFFVTSFLYSIAFLFAGFTQIILSIVKIKWLFFLLFGFVTIIKNEKKKLFILFVLIEILLGFFSYFSEFKTVIYYLFALLASFIVVVNFKYLLYGVLLGSGLIFVAILWTNVKGEYRSFLNAGKGQQTIEVSRDDALNKLYDLSSDVDQHGLERSIEEFLDRLQYTYHFAKTIDRVPSIIPYQNGNNWWDVLQFATTPRILNPDKPTIDNSVKTSKYTGLNYSGAKQGVSFSLGYFAECFIDFGYVGMIFPLMLLGLIYGKLFSYFVTKASPNLLFNYAVAGSFFMEFNAFEMDGTVLIGRLFASTVTYIILIKSVFPIVHKLLLAPTESK